MRIVFMGTPDFARDSLKSLVEAGHEIELVVTNPDKPKGRGMKMIPSEVKEYAISQGLEVVQPLKVRNNEEFVQKIRDINPDVICVVAYGKIIPKEILEIPKFGCINVHGSLLPKYRGAAPIQWAVINGDKETGVTTMFMDEGMDTGDMILKEEVAIGEREKETAKEVYEESFSEVDGDIIIDTDKIKLYFIRISRDEEERINLNLCIENKLDSDIKIEIKDVTVEACKTIPSFNCNVLAKSIVYEKMVFENNVEQLVNFKGTFLVIDSNLNKVIDEYKISMFDEE